MTEEDKDHFEKLLAWTWRASALEVSSSMRDCQIRDAKAAEKFLSEKSPNISDDQINID